MSTSFRFDPRRPVRFRIVLDDGGSYNVGVVENVSASGLFVETSEPLPVGTEVRLQALDPLEEPLEDVKARVVRCEEMDPDAVRARERDGAYGLGLELLGMRPLERQRIRDMIDRIMKEDPRTSRDPYVDPIL